MEQQHPNESCEPLPRYEYRYEVLGGTHNVLATKDLSEKHPDEILYALRCIAAATQKLHSSMFSFLRKRFA
jgi:hypothetical protein